MKQYSVQFGTGKAETVSEQQLEQMKAAYGQSFTSFTVKEIKEAAKPRDLQAEVVAEKPAKAPKTV
ncbi:hypothetical protein [Hymenobacter tenuis]